ncbi:MAG TPA: SDR family NAD(P)-dependent oxidoreductase [Candidatus Methylomirabilis sp.]|jgi:NAD(P)-dependent dehydrogenase (short-subunit alcohol dehydrogenase family)|nr:SDR family NAD(P)-dependent oxidoreductase [Candidatus Methylomirabilis sp.]
MRLKGKTAIVTGGGSGIGRAIALCLAREGADVIVPDISLAGAKAVAAEITRVGRRALAVQTDVTKGAAVAAMLRQALKTFGVVDILVNNAGIPAPIGLPFTNNVERDWDRVYQVNVKAIFLCCKAVAPHMITRKAGRIVNIASIAGQLGAATSPPYSVSKGGVITLTRVLARDLAAHGITVNAVCPGLLWTPMWEFIGAGMIRNVAALKGKTPREVFEMRVREWVPLRREQTPEDVGHAVAFLASEEARNITGQALNVDGGIYMH